MELKNFFAQDDQGNKLPGATCYLYLRGTESPVPGAVKANGAPLESPFTADSNGLIQLAAPNGLYDLRVITEGRDNRIRLQFNDVSESLDSAQAAAQQAKEARDSAQAAAQQAEAARDASQLSALLLMSFGQSNATRWSPRMTFSYPPSLLTFSGANETVDRSDGLSVGNALDGSVFDAVAPYSEFGKDKEGYAPGFAVASQGYGAILTHTPAIGGYEYRGLMSGLGAWTNLSNALRMGRKHLLASGYRKIDTLVLWDHGEADADLLPPKGTGSEGPITKAEYADVLKDLSTNLFATVRMMHQSPAATAVLMGVQPCLTPNDGARNVQSAHVEAARTVPGYHLAGPRYAFEYETDRTHIKATGKRRFAEYLALRHQDIVSGVALLPVHAVTAIRAGAVITATFATIQGDLVIDTANVPETSAAFPGSLYGVEYYYGGVQVPVTSVMVAGKVMTVTLSSVPVGAGELRIAQMTVAGTGSVSGPTSKLSRSCIRDSGSRLAKYDNAPLYNWACHQTISTN